MHKDVQQPPRSCWEVCDFCQRLIVEKRTHFKLEGITKTQPLQQDENIELNFSVLSKLFFFSYKQEFVISVKVSISIKKKKNPSPTPNLTQGLRFPNLTG